VPSPGGEVSPSFGHRTGYLDPRFVRFVELRHERDDRTRRHEREDHTRRAADEREAGWLVRLTPPVASTRAGRWRPPAAETGSPFFVCHPFVRDALQYDPSVNIREILIEPTGYIPPALALEGLSAADAERRIPGANHSVAEVVAHMTFWLDWFISRCTGEAVPMPAHAEAGWPAITRGSWLAHREQFLAALERAATLSDNARHDDPIVPPIEFPPLAHYRIRQAIVHMATHNAHHLGQVIVLRQLLGAWPPPHGGWSW
jgi:uncharacterized damage-inducible protein DinB